MNTINISKATGGTIQVPVAESFTMYGFKFGVHKSIEFGHENRWNVSEFSTGAKACNSQKTIKAAIAETKKRLKNMGKNELILAIEYLKNFPVEVKT